MSRSHPPAALAPAAVFAAPLADLSGVRRCYALEGLFYNTSTVSRDDQPSVWVQQTCKEMVPQPYQARSCSAASRRSQTAATAACNAACSL